MQSYNRNITTPAAKRSRRIAAALCACLLTFAFGCGGPPGPEECWKQSFHAGTRASERGEFDRAEAEFLQARMCAEELGAPDLRLSMALSELGTLYAESGRDEEAENSLRQAAAVQEQVLGHDHAQVAATLERLAALFRMTGRYEESITALERALAIRDAQESVMAPALATTLEDLAGSHALMGRYKQAVPLLERALVIRQTSLGPHHPSVVRTLGQLAEAHHQLGSNDDVFLSLSRSLRILGTRIAPADSLAAVTILRSGELLEEMRLQSLARRAPRKSAPATGARDVGKSRKVSPELQDEAVAALERGMAKLERGFFAEAALDFEAAHSSLPNDAELRSRIVKGYIVIGMEYYSDGRLEEAIHIWERALAIDPKNEQAHSFLDRIRKAMKKAKEFTDD